MISVVDLIVCLLCLARAAWKIHLAVAQVSLGDYLGALLGAIAAGKLIWSQQRFFKAIGEYLAKKGERVLVDFQFRLIGDYLVKKAARVFIVFQKQTNRDSDKNGDMN